MTQKSDAVVAVRILKDVRPASPASPDPYKPAVGQQFGLPTPSTRIDWQRAKSTVLSAPSFAPPSTSLYPERAEHECREQPETVRVTSWWHRLWRWITRRK